MRQLAHDSGRRRKQGRGSAAGLAAELPAGQQGWDVPIRRQLRLAANMRRRGHAGAKQAAALLAEQAELVPDASASLDEEAHALRAQSGAEPTTRDGRNGAAPPRVAIFIEPSPFSHVSGMKIRFLTLIEELRRAGDEVLVVTPDRKAPDEYHGAKVMRVLGVPLPFYKSATLLLGFGLSPYVLARLWKIRPDVIHVAFPGVLVFGAILYARLLSIPLVVSYHTHIPHYIPQYTWKGLVGPMWAVIRFCTAMADLTLVVSRTSRDILRTNGVKEKRLDVWQRAVDTQRFNPRFRCDEWRRRITNGHPERVVLTYVGRLGAEKNLKALRPILAALGPAAHLAFVGDGPYRPELEAHFAGTQTTFTGMLKGEDLSAAYASADIFVMPSESETLGFVAMEAMSSGLPVVAVAAGGLVDILRNTVGEAGFLYQPGDYEAATGFVRKLVEDDTLRQQMGREARLEAERWGWGPAVARVRRQYGRAIRIHRRRMAQWTPFSWLAAALRAVLAAVAWLATQPLRALSGSITWGATS